MPNIEPTRQALLLTAALRNRNINVELEHWDGYKHVDIYIPSRKIYIEIDGEAHYIQAKQMISDFKRDYFSSRDGFFTKHITNEAVENHAEEIAEAISAIPENSLL